MKMKKPAAKKVAKKTMAAKKPVRKMETGGMSGDPVKPKKDRWGRPEGSKYYGFNPETKKYEDKNKQKTLDYKRAAAKSPVRAAIDKKLGVNTLMTDPTPGFKKGGAVKKYQSGKMTSRKKK